MPNQLAQQCIAALAHCVINSNRCPVARAKWTYLQRVDRALQRGGARFRQAQLVLQVALVVVEILELALRVHELAH